MKQPFSHCKWWITGWKGSYELHADTNFKPDLKMKVAWNTCGTGICWDEACRWKLLLNVYLETSQNSTAQICFLEKLKNISKKYNLHLIV